MGSKEEAKMAKKNDVTIQESAGGHWSIYSEGIKIDGEVHRRLQDARASCQEQGWTIKATKGWTNPLPNRRTTRISFL